MSQLKVIESAAAFGMRIPAGVRGAEEEIVGAPATTVPIAAAEYCGVVHVHST